VMTSLAVIGGSLLRLRGRLVRILLLAGGSPLLLCLVQSKTRAAWLGVLAAAVLMLWLARRRRLLLVLAGLLVVGAIAAPASYRARLTSIVDPDQSSNRQRLFLWRAGVDLIREHPLTGLGDRSFRRDIPIYHYPDPDREPVHLTHLHSNPLMLALIWGLPGLALVGWVLWAMVAALLRRFRTLETARGPPVARGWTLAAIGAWTALVVSGLFDWNFNDAEYSLLLMLCVGIGLSSGNDR